MIKQIKFVSIPVRDQNRALDFYTDKLGFTIITDQPFDEKQRWIELRIPKAETRVVLFTPEGDEKRIGSFMNMSYACDDIDKTLKVRRKNSLGGLTRCSRTAKAIDSLFHRTERARPARLQTVGYRIAVDGSRRLQMRPCARVGSSSKKGSGSSARFIW